MKCETISASEADASALTDENVRELSALATAYFAAELIMLRFHARASFHEAMVMRIASVTTMALALITALGGWGVEMGLLEKVLIVIALGGVAVTAGIFGVRISRERRKTLAKIKDLEQRIMSARSSRVA